MTNEILLSDRAGVVIRETLVPHLKKNFFRLSNKPWLRYLGLNFTDDGVSALGSGSDAGRVKKVETMGVYNNQFKVVHQDTAFGGGVQGADEREALANGAYSATRSTATLKTIQGQFDITQQAQDALEGQGGVDAFVDEIVTNSKGAVHRVHKDMNRMFMSNGSGILCYLQGTTSSSTTVTVCSGGGTASYGGTGTNERTATRHIHKGDILWIGTTAQIVANSGYTEVTVTAVTGPTTFTISASQSLGDGANVYVVTRKACYSTTYTRYKEMTGMSSLVTNTGTVQGLNKANYAFFQSYLSNVAGAISDSAIQTMLFTCREYAENPADIFLVGNPTQWTRYASKLTSTKYLTPQTFEGKLAGGLEGLSVYSPDGNLPFFIDSDVPDGVIYAIDPNGYMLGYTKMMNFLPKLRSQTTLEDFFAFYVTAEMAQTNALSSGQLYGITS